MEDISAAKLIVRPCGAESGDGDRYKIEGNRLKQIEIHCVSTYFINAFAVESLVAQQRPHSCKAAKIKIDRKVIEADVEKVSARRESYN